MSTEELDPSRRTVIEAVTSTGEKCTVIVDYAGYAHSDTHGVLLSWHGCAVTSAVLTLDQAAQLGAGLEKAS